VNSKILREEGKIKIEMKSKRINMLYSQLLWEDYPKFKNQLLHPRIHKIQKSPSKRISKVGLKIENLVLPID